MRKSKRSAFTIVELVIVIAVIAILSAVLIPTFGSIIESANKAVDTQLVAQINTILAVEDVLGGGINDAVEIQKIIKDYGLKLQTKSKGQYIWYDIENKKAVLGGLDENGLVIETDAGTTTVPFNEDTTAPENFIKGYLFLSTESADNLAENIYALRNPEGETSDAVKASLNATLNKFKNTALKDNLTAMLSTTAVMTKDGVTGFIGDSNTSVTRIIVSSEMTSISTDTISTVLAYSNVVAVDFHSGVVTADDDAITALKGRTEKPYFIYSNDELKKVDTDNGNIAFLIHKDERGQYIKTVYLENVITGEKKSIASFLPEDEKYEFSYDLDYAYLPGSETESYDFIAYSFYKDGSNPLALGDYTYALDSTEKLLIDSNGNLTIYLVYEKATSDFKIGDGYYSSKTVTSMLADNGEASLPDDTTTITVVSTNAVLDDSFGTELTIPSGVELLLPFMNNTKQTIALANGGDTLVEMDFTADGSTKLTIAEGVNLVNQGSIYVDAQLYYHSTPVQSNIKKETSGVLEVNGTITSTGSITALGVIRGSGSIAANGGSVSEVMTIFDWHGGRDAATAVGAWGNDMSALAGLDVSGKNTTPFNNWRMQNIRVDVTLNYTTNYKVITAINVGDAKPIELLMAGPSDALFVMKSGSIVRTMSSEAINGKYNTKLIINGTVEDAAKTLTIDDVVIGASSSINFAKIAMPLSHFDVEITDNASLTISKNIYKVLPGSSIVVDAGGTLNIGTKVVFYNSYELEHTKTTKTPYYAYNSQTITRYGIAADGTHTAWEYKQSRDNYVVAQGPWEDTSDLPVQKTNVAYDVSSSALAIALPNTYPVTNRPAKLVVNGTVNFQSGAAFAGEIISETKNATINVASGVTVGGYLLPEGFFDTNNTETWYYTAVRGLHNFACLNGVEQSLSGTYTSTYDELLGRYTWNDK